MDLKTGDRVQMIGGSRVFIITNGTVSIGDWDVPCLTVADTEGNQTIMEWEFLLANFESLTETNTQKVTPVIKNHETKHGDEK